VFVNQPAILLNRAYSTESSPCTATPPHGEEENLTHLGSEMARAILETLRTQGLGTQPEDLKRLSEKLLDNIQGINSIVRQTSMVAEFISDLQPILKASYPLLIRQLSRWEEKGLFHFFKSAGTLQGRVLNDCSPEDLDRIGEGLTTLLGLVKKLSDPKISAFLHDITELISELDIDASRKTGPGRMLFALFDNDMQEGLGALVQCAKAFGKLKNRSYSDGTFAGTA
jgi:hypothetical protein